MSDTVHAGDGFRPILDRFRAETGVAIPDNRYAAAADSVRRALTRTKCRSTSEFLAALESDRNAFDALVEELVVPETYFFRDPRQFEAIRKHVLPEILANRSNGEPIYVWSAGCASGEEPYSLAILMEQEGLTDRARILATDISQAALAKARRGEYSQWSLRGCRDDFTERFFTRRNDRYVLAPRMRRSVRFERLNLARKDDSDFSGRIGGMDIVLCRNVLIYFDAESIRRVAQRLFGSLARGGWLIAGPSDPPLWEYAPFEIVAISGCIFYRREALDRISAPIRPIVSARVPDSLPPPSEPPTIAPGPARPAVPPVTAAPDRPASTQVVREEKTIEKTDLVAIAKEAFARGEYSRAAELTQRLSKDVHACVLHIRSLANLGRSAEAQAAAEQAASDHPFVLEIRHLAAIVALGAGRAESAVAQARSIIYLDRSSAAGHLILGAALRATGDIVGARRAYRNGHALCAQRPADEIVPLTDGERAGRLAEAARVQLAALRTGNDTR